MWAQQDVRFCIQGVHKYVGDLKQQVRQNPAEEKKMREQVEIAPEVKENSSPSKMGTLRRNLSQKVSKFLGGTASQRTGNQSDGDGTRASSPGAAAGNTKTRSDTMGTTCSLPGSKGKVKKYLVAGHRAPMKPGEFASAAKQADSPEDQDQGKSTAPPKKHAPRLRTLPNQDVRFFVLHNATAPAAGRPKPILKDHHGRQQEFKSPSQNMTNDNQRSWGKTWRHMNNAPGAQDRHTQMDNIYNYYQTATDRLSHDVPLFERAHSIYAVHEGTRRHLSALQTERQKIVYRFGAQMQREGGDAQEPLTDRVLMEGTRSPK
jgi:hypothetical protein